MKTIKPSLLALKTTFWFAALDLAISLLFNWVSPIWLHGFFIISAYILCYRYFYAVKQYTTINKDSVENSK